MKIHKPGASIVKEKNCFHCGARFKTTMVTRMFCHTCRRAKETGHTYCVARVKQEGGFLKGERSQCLVPLTQRAGCRDGLEVMHPLDPRRRLTTDSPTYGDCVIKDLVLMEETLLKHRKKFIHLNGPVEKDYVTSPYEEVRKSKREEDSSE